MERRKDMVGRIVGMVRRRGWCKKRKGDNEKKWKEEIREKGEI